MAVDHQRPGRRGAPARITLALCCSIGVLALRAPPAAAIVLSEDELEERSDAIGLLIRTFTFVLAGPTLRPPFSPVDNDPAVLSITDLRLSYVHKSPRWKIDVQGQVTPRVNSLRSASAAQAGGGTGGSSGGVNLGRGVPPPRWLPLQVYIANEQNIQLTARLDWAYLALQLGPVALTIGRQPITLGRGKLWHPLDLVAMFSLTEVDTEIKPGADALRLDWQIATRSALNVYAVAGELEADSDAELSLRGSAFLARFQQSWSRGELGVSGGFVRGDAVVGVDGFFDALWADLYGELVVHVLTDESLTPNTEILCGGLLPGCASGGGVDRAVVRGVLGATFRPGKNVTLAGELYYNGFGSFDRADYFALATSERARIGELVAFGVVYAGLLASWEPHPLVTLSAVTLANLRDPSGLLSLAAVYSVANNVQLVGGVYLPLGRVPSVAGPLPVPRSEYGSYPYFIFTELKAAF